MKAQILLVEDDVNVGNLVHEVLCTRSYNVEWAQDGQEALDLIARKHFDMVLSDISMPRMDGLQMLKVLRDGSNAIPVIFVSVRNGITDMLQAYELGCDDYVVKPFTMELVIAKMEAVLRRCKLQQMSDQTVFQLGESVYDSVRQTLDGKHLSSRENSLMLMLCQNLNSVVERSRILLSVWGQDTYFNARSLSVYINHLRRHFGPDTKVRIMSCHNKGYKMVVME